MCIFVKYFLHRRYEHRKNRLVKHPGFAYINLCHSAAKT